MGNIRALVADHIRRKGAAAVARKLGVSREAVLAYGAGFRTQLGTDVLIESRAGLLDQ
jgi:hypothetical protein